MQSKISKSELFLALDAEEGMTTNKVVEIGVWIEKSLKKNDATPTLVIDLRKATIVDQSALLALVQLTCRPGLLVNGPVLWGNQALIGLVKASGLQDRLNVQDKSEGPQTPSLTPQALEYLQEAIAATIGVFGQVLGEEIRVVGTPQLCALGNKLKGSTRVSLVSLTGNNFFGGILLHLPAPTFHALAEKYFSRPMPAESVPDDLVAEFLNMVAGKIKQVKSDRGQHIQFALPALLKEGTLENMTTDVDFCLRIELNSTIGPLALDVCTAKPPSK